MPLKPPTPWQGRIEGTGTFKWAYEVDSYDDECFDEHTAKRIAVEFMEGSKNYCGDVVVTEVYQENAEPEEDHRDA